MEPEPPMNQTMDDAMLPSVLESVRRRAADSGQFASVEAEGGALRCAARDSGAPAAYRVFAEGGRVWVALETPDRYLSQSIEQDLVHTGDKLEEVFDEELADVALRLGLRGALPPAKSPKFEHFRDERKRFTFRMPVALAGLGEAAAADRALLCLLACEQTFRPLGDMEAGDEAD